jgi:hypothetical protein
MSADKLTVATSSYAIQYSDTATHATRTRSPTPQSQDSERLSLLEAVSDERIWHASRSRYTLPELPYTLPLPRPSFVPTLPRSLANFRSIAQFALDGDEDTSQATAQGNAFLDNCDWPPLNDPSATSSGLTRAPTPPPFTVTTQMESSDDDHERGNRENSYRPYGMPPRIPIDNTDSETDTDDASDASMARRMVRLDSLIHAQPVRRSSPGHIAHESSVERDEEDEDAEMIDPNARFFMPENNCRITIRFNPPV